MRFTKEQYEAAIANLRDGMQQLEPDGNCCSICGDSGHQAFECGHNPLLAMHYCEVIAKQSEQLHQTLHYLAGWDRWMGEQVGPARVMLPDEDGGAALDDWVQQSCDAYLKRLESREGQ